MYTQPLFGMNNSYLLKKQLKDNEEELSNYLRDMNIWKDQMKRKEHTSPLEVNALNLITFLLILIYLFNFRIMVKKNLKWVKVKYCHVIIQIGTSLILYEIEIK